MRHRLAWCCVALALCVPALAQQASNAVPATSEIIVPRLIRFSGQMKSASGTVGITFTLHKSQEDNTPLWIETQNVSIDATGKYTVLLGATKAEGIPMDLFTSGEAQWLGIQAQGQAESPRVLLVSVPYALKAAEADTLAGHAASEFVTSDKLSTAVQQQLQQSGAVTTTTTGTTKKEGTKPQVTTSGATNFTDNTANQVVLVTQNGTGYGLEATTATGSAIYGLAANSGSTASNVGILGVTQAGNGTGIWGEANASSGANYGLRGSTKSTSGTAIYSVSTATSGSTTGVFSAVASPSGTAMVLRNTGSGMLITGATGSANTRVFGVDGSGNVTGNTFTSNVATGVAPFNVSSGTMVNNLNAQYLQGYTPSSFVQTGNTNTFSVPQYITSSSSSIPALEVTENSSSVPAISTSAGWVGTWNNASEYGSVNYSSYVGSYDSGVEYGVWGYSTEGWGVYGEGTSIGVVGDAPGFGVEGVASDTGGAGVLGSTASGYGVYGINGNTTYPAAAFYNEYGASISASAVWGTSGSGQISDISSVGFYAGAAQFSGPNGIIGAASSDSSVGDGVIGINAGESGRGVVGWNTGVYGTAIYGNDGSGSSYAYAGYFAGNVEVTGTLNGAAPVMKIDDPRDPANKYLTQASITSSEMLSEYSGTVVLDESGSAVVKLPAYFESLNKDFRYQLTCIGGYAPVYIASEVSSNTFSIGGGKPGMKVSWQVSGVRHDAFATAHPLLPEQAKPAHEAGRYLTPREFGLSPKLAITSATQTDVHRTTVPAKLKIPAMPKATRPVRPTVASPKPTSTVKK